MPEMGEPLQSGGSTRMAGLRKSRKGPYLVRGPGVALLDTRRAGRMKRPGGPLPVSRVLVPCRILAICPGFGRELDSLAWEIGSLRVALPLLWSAASIPARSARLARGAHHPLRARHRRPQAARVLIGGPVPSDARTRPAHAARQARRAKPRPDRDHRVARRHSAQVPPGLIRVRVRGVRRRRARWPEAPGTAHPQRPAARALPRVGDSRGQGRREQGGRDGHQRCCARLERWVRNKVVVRTHRPR
jgi:hypothetical protein